MSADFTNKLRDKLNSFDKPGAATLCEELITQLYQTDKPFPAQEAEQVLQLLRNKRYFSLMQQVADALIQTGQGTFRIRRQYIQSLLDQNNLTAALALLSQLISDTSNAPALDSKAAKENIEAKGLLGRAYKQLYVNAKNPATLQNQQFLKQAILAYSSVYTTAPDTHLWHGINIVALHQRAERDGVKLAGLSDATAIAEDILTELEERHISKAVYYWDYATAAEACLALDRFSEALEWIGRYVHSERVDAFEIVSTLRQLTEVWQLSIESDPGNEILPLLQSELLSREGGKISMTQQEWREQKQDESSVSSTYERVFGNTGYNTYRWYMTGAARCLCVARIGIDATQGFGTGFLLKGSDLSPVLNDDLVLLTNAHVVSDDKHVTNCLRSHQTIITFESLNSQEEFRIGKILWSSRPDQLDTTVISFADKDLPRLRELTKHIECYPIASEIPEINDTQRLYIVGHPKGGTLQISLQDNLLLDHKSPKIHYRTPTDPGSSGSPVFDNQWRLVGIHHAGSDRMPRLHGQPGTYPANEGIWIGAIQEALKMTVDSSTS